MGFNVISQNFCGNADQSAVYIINMYKKAHTKKLYAVACQPAVFS